MAYSTDIADGERILVVAPTAEDAALSLEILGEAGFTGHACVDAGELSREIVRGAGAILMTEGILRTSEPDRVEQAVRLQPEWSDIPILLLAGGGTDAPAAVWLMESLGNVTVLDRPVRIITLISAVRSALKARHRQYQVRDQLATIREGQRWLEEEARRKDAFLATLAHELRNPLAPISSSLYLLRHPGAAPEQRSTAVAMMSRQVAHMVRLVDDLLDVSRITRGSVELRYELIDLRNAVAAAVDAAQPLIAAGKHTLSITLPEEPVTIEADAVRLTQIFTNLLNNAAKYTTDPGTISVTCKIGQDRNGVECLNAEVSDTGAGIPAEMLGRVFDMFTQVPRTREQAQGGLGIGLTLAKSLVELHGGAIEAASAGPGLGSQFRFGIPLRRQAAEVEGDAAA